MSAGEKRALEARGEFPILASSTYLNSNSTGAFPRGMKAVLDDYWISLREWSDAGVWERWWTELHSYADAVAAFLGAPPGSVVTNANVSSLLGRLLTCFDYRGERRRIVTTAGDFPTVPFLTGQFARYGAELVVAPMAKDGSFDEEALEALIDERVRIVCVSHASYANGALLDVPRIARRCHDAGVLLAVDAYQSIGAVPLDVETLGADFVLGGAHKWLCGSTEIAFLYIRPRILERLEPAATGWVASLDPLSFGEVTEYASSARRFASGTPQVLPALLSRIGLEILGAVGIDTIRQLSLRRTEWIARRAEDAGIEVLTPREDHRRGGIVSLRFPGDDRAVAMLAERGFVCSHRGSLRVAPHFYNTEQECDSFVDALLEVRKEVA
jgi:selenocysteine lyase/cysteine desulfurase